LKDYYEVLGIRRHSTLSEVKKSFRKKAKKLHPDLRPSGHIDLASDEDMKILLKAYEVLSNPKKRREYDRLLKYIKPQVRQTFNYREFLKQRKDDLFSQAKLILYDLLNSNTRQALTLYNELCLKRHFHLKLYLKWDDYMDCAFLLAEQFAEEGEYIKAIELFKQIFVDETRRPYFKHFIEEVILRIMQIVSFRLLSEVPPDISLKYLNDLIGLDFSRKDKALLYKKMAEAYLHQGRNELARHSLSMGLRCNSKLPGIKKLKEKLGFHEILVPS
jgi:hypothetical protein